MLKEVKRSRQSAEFIVKHLPDHIIVELPKEKRETPVTKPVEKKVVLNVSNEPEETATIEEETPVEVDFSKMGKIELTAFIKNAKNSTVIEPLLKHELKTIRELAEKKTKELN